MHSREQRMLRGAYLLFKGVRGSKIQGSGFGCGRFNAQGFH